MTSLSALLVALYGFFALTFMTPLLRAIFGVDAIEIYNMASAGVVIGILIIPMVGSLSEDALSACRVPFTKQPMDWERPS